MRFISALFQLPNFFLILPLRLYFLAFRTTVRLTRAQTGVKTARTVSPRAAPAGGPEAEWFGEANTAHPGTSERCFSQAHCFMTVGKRIPGTHIHSFLSSGFFQQSEQIEWCHLLPSFNQSSPRQNCSPIGNLLWCRVYCQA